MSSTSVCPVTGCERNSRSKQGWCGLHWKRWKRNGDPNTLVRNIVAGSLEDRFWARVEKNGPVPPHRPELGPCWIWTGTLSKGYGVIARGKRGEGHVITSRLSWEMVNGAIPDDLLVCHACDNPPCCRPSHLFLGTDYDNARDRDSKGRQIVPIRRGTRNAAATITEAEVRQIRNAVSNGQKRREVARDFGVSYAIVCRIVSGETWSHVA